MRARGRKLEVSRTRHTGGVAPPEASTGAAEPLTPHPQTPRDWQAPSAFSCPDCLGALIHQLSQPLTSLHGSLELALLSDASVEAYHLALEQTLVEADRLVELLHWFRELGEAENPLQAGERVLLGELVMQAVEETRPLAEARGLSVVVEVSGDFAVRADSARLREVMLRVMMNALQRSPAGGRVRIALSELPGYACLSVSDQGRAAPAAELAALQAPPCPVPQFLRAAKGYHLPWAIAKRASEALGGTVQLENLAPEGCCFQIRLPLAQEAEP